LIWKHETQCDIDRTLAMNGCDVYAVSVTVPRGLIPETREEVPGSAIMHLDKRICQISKVSYDAASFDRPYLKGMTAAFLAGVRRVRV
jgi:hypothetical protein